MSATPLIAEPEAVDVSGLLKVAAPFGDLPVPVLKAIADVAEMRDYAAGEAVFALGQFDGGEFYVVTKGALKAAFTDPENGAVHIEDIDKGGMFGLADTIAANGFERADLFTLTAEADAQVVAIDAQAFCAVVAQRPTLTRNLMHHFAEGVVRARFGASPVDVSPERRVFAALLEFVERDAVQGDWRIPHMPKHRELAERSGADENSAASAVAQLIQDGVAYRDYPGLVIEDMSALRRLAN